MTLHSAKTADILDRLNAWLEDDDATDADRTLRAARDEIVALRAMLTRESESSILAVRLMTDNASRYGFLMGGLEMVAAGHTTADAVLAAFGKKFATETYPK